MTLEFMAQEDSCPFPFPFPFSITYPPPPLSSYKVTDYYAYLKVQSHRVDCPLPKVPSWVPDPWVQPTVESKFIRYELRQWGIQRKKDEGNQRRTEGNGRKERNRPTFTGPFHQPRFHPSTSRHEMDSFYSPSLTLVMNKRFLFH